MWKETLGIYSNNRLFDMYLCTFYLLNYVHQRAAIKKLCKNIYSILKLRANLYYYLLINSKLIESWRAKWPQVYVTKSKQQQEQKHLDCLKTKGEKSINAWMFLFLFWEFQYYGEISFHIFFLLQSLNINFHGNLIDPFNMLCEHFLCSKHCASITTSET